MTVDWRGALDIEVRIRPGTLKLVGLTETQLAADVSSALAAATISTAGASSRFTATSTDLATPENGRSGAMSDGIDILAAELYDLWVAGKISLPQVAAVYAQTTRDIHNTSWQETDAFARSTVTVEIESGILPSLEEVKSLGPVYPHWRRKKTS